jgi:hypothetical protein
MSLSRPVISDGTALRQLNNGDTLAGGEAIPATVVTTAITVTGAQLLSGKILRNPGAGATDTIDSAANIIAAINNALGGQSVPSGTTWRCHWIGTTAFTITVQATANTGVTVTRGAIAASSGKEFLITVTNGSPAKAANFTTVNASAVMTAASAADIAGLTPGMVVTNAQAGQQGNTIIGVNLTALTVTMSGNCNATNTTAVSFSFSPTVLVEGLLQGLS